MEFGGAIQNNGGEVIEMLKSLTDLGYLSRCDGGYVLYDAPDFNPYFQGS